MLATKDVTDRVDLIDFTSDISNRVLIGFSMESNYIYNRMKDGITITLPDYFLGLPDHVLTDAVLNVIRMENERRMLQTDFLTDDIVRTRDRLRRIRLYKDFRFTQKGRNKDIAKAIDNLLDMGLIDQTDIANASFTWENIVSNEHYGSCLTGVRIVVINPFLDYSIVSWRAFESVVYHEILHLRQQGMGLKLEDPHDDQFRKWELEYPLLKEANEDLVSIGDELDRVSGMKKPPKDIGPYEAARTKNRFQPTGLLRSFFPHPIKNTPVIGLGFDEMGECYYRTDDAFEFYTGEKGIIVTLDRRLQDSSPDIIRRIRKDVEYSLFTSEPSQDETVLAFIRRQSDLSRGVQTKMDPSIWSSEKPEEVRDP